VPRPRAAQLLGGGARRAALEQAREVVERHEVQVGARKDALAHQVLQLVGVQLVQLRLGDAVHAGELHGSAGAAFLGRGLHAERLEQRVVVKDRAGFACALEVGLEFRQQALDTLPARQGLAGLVEYVTSTRPVREIQDELELPLIHLMAEGDYVTTAFVRPEEDAAGNTYYSSWFDLYRIEDGLIAEHWDPMLKSDPRIDPNDKTLD